MTPTQEHKTPADILNAAAELIEPEGRWWRGDFAADASGAAVDECSPSAVCWCALGALTRAIGGLGAEQSWQLYQSARGLLIEHVGEDDISDWNDAPERTQAEVVAALREAARRAEGVS